MTLPARQRRTINSFLLGAFLIGQVAGLYVLPRPAIAALSADPNAEIVYIDHDGVIHVLDTQGDPLVQWFSPDSGWDQIVLLDVNNDGDQEILALDKLDGVNSRVALYDPVVALGATDLTKEINGIPWDKLYDSTFAGEGKYIVGGNFDPGINGDEFAVGFTRGDSSIVQIWDASTLGSNGNPTGREWKQFLEKEYPTFQYTYGTAGNLDDKGADELILFDQDSATTRMDVYQTDRDMFLTDSETASNDRFKSGVAGQLIKDGQDELAAILTISTNPSASSILDDKPSLRTYILNDKGELEEDFLAAFTPQPEWAFLADIRGNGDKELFFIRNYPEGQDGARLIMRDDWGDDQRQNTDLIEWSLMDDGANNEFRAGAGGDIDGDGKDEVVLMRDDRIRVYGNPENGNDSSANFTDYILNTKTDNKRINLLIGDLDRNGFSTGPILQVSGNLIESTIPAGTISQDYFVSVANIGAPSQFGVNAIVPSSDTSWAQINPTFASPPVSFRVRFNATKLSPGQYNTTMTLKANVANVFNDNYIVHLNLTVIAPTLNPDPPILSIYPCVNTICNGTTITETHKPITSTIKINGAINLAFRATILGVPSQDGSHVAASGLAGPITGGKIDENGNIVVFDDLGNSRTVSDAEITASAATSATVLVDPALTWVVSATLDGNVAPAKLTMVVDPSILTKKSQREYAVLVLVADTRAGTPNTNVYLVPIEMAKIGGLLWIGALAK